MQVADQYAFIPREAISKFLLYCIECQRKNSMEHRNGGRPPNGSAAKAAAAAASTGGVKRRESDEPMDTSTQDSSDNGTDYRPISPASSLPSYGGRDSPKITANTLSPPVTPNSPHLGANSLSSAAAFSQAMAAMQNMNQVRLIGRKEMNIFFLIPIVEVTSQTCPCLITWIRHLY